MKRVLLILVLLVLVACGSEPKMNEDVNVDLFQYKGSYVGDNSTVINSVTNLQGAKHFSGLELKTNEEPYGVTVNYDWIESELDNEKTAITNASYLFALIQNVDWLTFNFEMVDGMEEYKISRENLQAWYGIELSEIDNEEKLKEIIQKSLKDDEKVHKF